MVSFMDDRRSQCQRTPWSNIRLQVHGVADKITASSISIVLDHVSHYHTVYHQETVQEFVPYRPAATSYVPRS